MKLKKEYIFIIINYTIFCLCWITFDIGLILMDNRILSNIGLLAGLVHTLLLFGGECILYYIFSFKNNIRVVLNVLLISFFIDISINILTRSMNDIIMAILINQIIGVIIGRICFKMKNNKL